MLPMGDRLLPSSRMRAWVYVPHLEEAGFTIRALDRLASRSAAAYGLRVLAGLPRADLVYVQKRLLPGPLLRLCRRVGKPVVYDFDDAIFYREDGSPSPRAGRLRACLEAASHIVAGNDYLAAYARELNPRVSVVPTPVRVGPGAGRDPSRNGLRLVWIGSRSTLPHLLSIAPALAQACRDLPGVTLKVIAPGAVDLPGVAARVVPWSLEREEAELGECDVGLMPLPDNPFTRGKCAYKALQCMALGMPVIVSPVGFNRDLVSNGREGLWAGSLEEWVGAIRRFAEAPDLVAGMGRAARARAEAFSIERCGAALIRVLREASGRLGPAAARVGDRA